MADPVLVLFGDKLCHEEVLYLDKNVERRVVADHARWEPVWKNHCERERILADLKIFRPFCNRES